MKEKTKEFMKKYLIGFILGILTVGIIKVSAETFFPSNQVTYDNRESGLSSTNVQGAIDELYNTCFPKAGEQIIENAGLEKDPYECRYFFTGGNPNNYVTFNNEQAGWRIISVECDGTIKIMRIASIGDMAWDTSDSTNWARPTSLNTYLNGTYYNGLNDAAKSQIVSYTWSIGYLSSDLNNLSNQINVEKSSTWNGKIALPTLSEYIRSNSNKSSCGTFSTFHANSSTCINTTWMRMNEAWWSLTPSSGKTVFYVNNPTFNIATYPASLMPIRPTLYLSSEVQITGGDGTQSNPYVVE